MYKEGVEVLEDLGIMLVVIQLGVSCILCQYDYLTNILANIFLMFMERVREIIFNQYFHSYQTAPICWVNILAQFVRIYKFMNTRFQN